MAARSPFDDPSLRLVAQGLVALHRLIQDGKGDSPGAEAVRDALDAPLKALNAIEKERAQWLSEDLYAVSEPPVATIGKKPDPEAQQVLDEALKARQGQEWDRVLILVRRLREHIAPALLSYLRGSVWLEARYPEVAAEFCRDASESDPANADFRAIYVDAMSRLAEVSVGAGAAPWKEHAGCLRDSPLYEPWREAMEAYRRELDDDPDAL